MMLHATSIATSSLSLQPSQELTGSKKESPLKTSLSATLQARPNSQSGAALLAQQQAANGDEISDQERVGDQEFSVKTLAATDLAKQMQSSALKASQLLKSLSHPDRLLLLCQLTQGEYCVGELETLVGVGQPSLSQQLGILRKDKLVVTRREGKQIYYRIASEDALAVLELLYNRFCPAD